MKIRIKKTPLKTELNASHWKHLNGGHLFLEAGLTFKRPQDDLTRRNILTSPILPPKSYYEQFTVPELEPKKPQPLQPLEGTYGSKYSELIPMSDGTYVNNPINKGLLLDWRTHALEFAPFLAIGAGPAMGSTATWLATSKPALYNLGRMTLGSEIGGRSVDLASNLFTDNTWGLNVGNVVEGTTGWNPNNTMVGLFITDLTNPGYTGKEGLASLAGLFSKFGKNIRNKISNVFEGDRMYGAMLDERNLDNFIKGVNYDVSGISDDVKTSFETQVFPRIKELHPKVDLEKIRERLFKTKNYLIESDNFSKVSNTPKGAALAVSYGPGNLHSAISDNSGKLMFEEPYTEGHELRHTLQRLMGRANTREEKRILKQAYGLNSDIVPPHEYETMNYDARHHLLSKFKFRNKNGDFIDIAKSNIEDLNKMIDAIPDDKFLEEIYHSDGYWYNYMNYLYDKGVDLTSMIPKWKEAMKKVGITVAPVAIFGSSKNKE